MSLIFALLGLALTAHLSYAGQFGLHTTEHFSMPGSYAVVLEQLPDCSGKTCYGLVQLRWHYDRDGLDPDTPDEDRSFVAVQIGVQRGRSNTRATITVLDNSTGTTVRQPVGTADPAHAIMVSFQGNDPENLVLTFWWRPVGSLEWKSKQVLAPLIPGTIRKRALVTALLSKPLPFVALVEIREFQNFNGWDVLNKQAGCTRDDTVHQNTFRVVCTPETTVSRR